MGVLNLTTDSFSDGGKYADLDAAVLHALHMIEEGADLLDLGAESTRPGAKTVHSGDQIKKLVPLIQAIRKKTDIPLSIDTTRGEVAEICLDEGADIINDVSGLHEDGNKLLEAATRFQAGLILMHRRGNAKTMQQQTNYDKVEEDVLAELCASVRMAEAADVERERVMIDPGLGFSKTAEQNIVLMRKLETFRSLGLPVLLGPSRKSFLGFITGADVSDREFATVACGAWAFLKNIQMLRVHEIKPMKDVLRVLEAFTHEHDETKEIVDVRT